jgi:CorA-like Mg2+ transporter protein
MADFHYFNNYWFFNELTTKDEEFEHFRLLSEAYQIGTMKSSIGDQIDKLAAYIDRLYTLRSSDAVNRLAMLSVILGIGALITGFYGMNVPLLEELLHNGIASRMSLLVTAFMTLTSVSFIIYIVFSNWKDYRVSLLPRRFRRSSTPNSFRRLRHMEEDQANPESLTPADLSH